MSYQIGDHSFKSRLIVGTGKYADLAQTRAAMLASGAEMVTVAIRRTKTDAPKGENIYEMLRELGMIILPNTAGCYTVKDAVLTARLAREALGTSLIKIEVIGDEKTLFPDNEATIEAAKTLVKDGFTVLPYCSDDPIVCRKLADVGCAAVMPLAAPIGSGLGIRNPTNIHIIIETVDVPVIVDAGVGTASDAAVAMELGCTAVLMNTGIAKAQDPVKMAQAMKLAIEGGRLAFEAGRMPVKLYASASSPIEGVLRS